MKSFAEEWNLLKKESPVKVKLIAPEKYVYGGAYIELISTPVEHRGKGLASIALQTVIDLVARHNVDLYLDPEALGQGCHNALDQTALEGWYSRHGFKPFNEWTWKLSYK